MTHLNETEKRPPPLPRHLSLREVFQKAHGFVAEGVQETERTIINKIRNSGKGLDCGFFHTFAAMNWTIIIIETIVLTLAVVLKNNIMTIDTTNMCSHLQKKLFEEDGEYHRIWIALQNDPELTAVVRSRQLHIYRNGKKVLVLAGKSAPKIIREDRISEML